MLSVIKASFALHNLSSSARRPWRGFKNPFKEEPYCALVKSVWIIKFNGVCKIRMDIQTFRDIFIVANLNEHGLIGVTK